MNQSEISIIESQLEFLLCVLNYSHEYEALFYRGEKICINQLRGSLFDHLNFLNGDLEIHNVRIYELPEAITEKIQSRKNKIIKLYNL